MNDVTVQIVRPLRGHVTPRGLIEAVGYFNFQSNYAELNDERAGVLFALISQDYRLEVGSTGTHFYIKRNRQKIEIAFVPVYRPNGDFLLVAFWQPDQLSLGLWDETWAEAASGMPESAKYEEWLRRLRILETPITYPPYSLVQWARKEAIAPMSLYDSVEQLNEVVATSLESINDKVSSFGLNNPFWDITYDGSSIASRQPKREHDIHPTIYGFLFDIAIAKNLRISPEHPIAGGNVDFLISGTLANGKLASVCVEFKHAHSDDLEDGLLKQLPAYMQAEGCDFGIYCVMYFRGQHFSEPSNYNLESLRLHLENRKRSAWFPNIRILILDLSHRKSPSRL